MDLRARFRKMREIEATIEPAYVVVVSEETSDGGREGVLTEVTREQAAWMVLDRRAKLASEEDTKAYHREQMLARKKAAAEQRQ